MRLHRFNLNCYYFCIKVSHTHKNYFNLKSVFFPGVIERKKKIKNKVVNKFIYINISFL